MTDPIRFPLERRLGRPLPPTRPGGTDPRLPAFIVYGAVLASMVFVFVPIPYAGTIAAIIGVVIAASNRAGATAHLASHYEFGLRTLVVGVITTLVLSLLARVPLIGGLAWLAILGVVGWAVLRAGLGLTRLIGHKANPDPRGWLL